MPLWAIVPAKDPALGKTRLASVLDTEARRRLSLGLLEHTVRAALVSPAVARVVVVSAAEAPLALAARLAVLPLPEARVLSVGTAHRPGATIEAGLNAALSQATRTALAGGADAVLVLHADLPLLTPRAIDALVAALPGGGGAVLAPDRLRAGTNALLLRPPLALPFLFGHRSFARHVQAAWEHELPYVVAADLDLAADLDTPEDLVWLRECAAMMDSDPWLRALLADLEPVQTFQTSIPLDERPRLRCGP